MLTLLYVTVGVAAVRGLWSPCGLSMLSSLNPVSEQARGHRFWITAGWYLLGSIAGGGVLGACCAVAAWGSHRLDPSAAVTWTLVLVAALVAAASDARLGGWSLPVHPRQVDERWLTSYRRWLYASGYGVQIGIGFATYIMTAGVYLMAALAVLSGRPLAALGAGLGFGLVRGLGIAVTGLARDPEGLRTLLGRIDSWSGASVFAACLACAGVAVAAAARLGGALPAAAVAVLLGAAVGVRSRPALAR
jgi:hypothetical protein